MLRVSSSASVGIVNDKLLLTIPCWPINYRVVAGWSAHVYLMGPISDGEVYLRIFKSLPLDIKISLLLNRLALHCQKRFHFYQHLICTVI